MSGETDEIIIELTELVDSLKAENQELKSELGATRKAANKRIEEQQITIKEQADALAEKS